MFPMMQIPNHSKDSNNKEMFMNKIWSRVWKRKVGLQTQESQRVSVETKDSASFGWILNDLQEKGSGAFWGE